MVRFFLLILIFFSGSNALAEENTFRPQEVNFDFDIEYLQKILPEKCDRLVRRTIPHPFLETVEKIQEQLDCMGFSFEGKKRHAEFMFADGRLDGVWIMTEANEEQKFIDMFAEIYGTPDYRFPHNTVFLKANALVRNDIPEILYYSERMAPYYLEWFEAGAPE